MFLNVLVSHDDDHWVFLSFRSETDRVPDRDGDDADIVVGLVRLGVGLNVADVLRHLHAPDHPREHRVLVVQPRRGAHRDEELGAVGVGPGVGHGHGVGPVVAELRAELVLELQENPPSS